jgi:hypothetical protein
MTMKSLAHPDWPYAGTAHEWRGFVKRDAPIRAMTYDEFKAFVLQRNAVYQKQNFGPELK